MRSPLISCRAGPAIAGQGSARSLNWVGWVLDAIGSSSIPCGTYLRMRRPERLLIEVSGPVVDCASYDHLFLLMRINLSLLLDVHRSNYQKMERYQAS